MRPSSRQVALEKPKEMLRKEAVQGATGRGWTRVAGMHPPGIGFNHESRQTAWGERLWPKSVQESGGCGVRDWMESGVQGWTVKQEEDARVKRATSYALSRSQRCGLAYWRFFRWAAGLPHVCNQLRVDRMSERGRGNWALSPIMQRDSPAHSPGGNCQVPKRSKRGQSHAQGFSVSACATFVTGPPAQSNHLAMPDSRMERQASLLSEKESVALFLQFTQMTKSRVIQLWEAKPSFRQRWAQEALLWEPHPLVSQAPGVATQRGQGAWARLRVREQRSCCGRNYAWQTQYRPREITGVRGGNGP